MTDEELAAIRGWYGNERAAWKRGVGPDVRLMPSYPWVRYFDALLAEVERLRAENAALREIAQAVTEVYQGNFGLQHDAVLCYDDNHDEYICPWCHGSVQYAHHPETFEHEDECTVTKARALLAGEQKVTQESAHADAGTDEEDAPLDWRDALEQWGLEQARRRMRWDPVRGYVFDREVTE